MTKVRKNVIINIRVDEDLKESSKEILAKHNIDHSKAVRRLLEYVAKNKCLPDFYDDAK